MSEQRQLLQYEIELSYCCSKTHSKNFDAAMHYGRLSGFFTYTNKLTLTESRMAKFLSDETKAA